MCLCALGLAQLLHFETFFSSWSGVGGVAGLGNKYWHTGRMPDIFGHTGCVPEILFVVCCGGPAASSAAGSALVETWIPAICRGVSSVCVCVCVCVCLCCVCDLVGDGLEISPQGPGWALGWR